MANLTGNERARYVREMFARIAPRYDLLNRLMSAGRDLHWRREAIRRLRLFPGAALLDLGAGTGDLAVEALRQQPDCFPVAADFTLEMMRVGQRRPVAGRLAWSAADALNLPFAGETFDAMVSGFLMRNVVDLPGALCEQRRVLKPGGRLVILDTTHPPQNLLAPAIQFHLHRVIPALGRWISGQADAYRYLPDSTESFLSAEKLAWRMLNIGLREVGFQLFMFGTVAVHWGIR